MRSKKGVKKIGKVTASTQGIANTNVRHMLGRMFRCKECGATFNRRGTAPELEEHFSKEHDISWKALNARWKSLIEEV